MTLEDLARCMAQHVELEYCGHDDDTITLRWVPRETAYRCDLADLADYTAEDLLAVLQGTREPVVMRHYTRIVGYYSELANWNRSKLAELRDRRQGQYLVH
jgi:hypothetical protein